MTQEEISCELKKLASLIDIGGVKDFEDCFIGVNNLLEEIKRYKNDEPFYYKVLSQIAAILTDVGHMQPNLEASDMGLQIVKENKNKIIKQVGESTFYYNFSNAISNSIIEKEPFNHTFHSIEELIDLKLYLWKAIKLSSDDITRPEYIVNLGNALKQQFRITEAIKYYDDINALNLDIPQSWINKSESLEMLHKISNNYSIRMLQQIKEGYEKILASKQIYSQWLPYYEYKINFFQKKIEEARFC